MPGLTTLCRVFERAPSLEEAQALTAPFIVKGYAKRWPAFERWTWDYLREKLAGDPVIVGDRIGAPSQLKKLPFAEFVDWLLAAGPEERPRWYTLQYSPFAAHPELLEDFSFPEFCRSLLDFKERDWYLKEFGWIFAGPAGTRSVPHVDLFSTHAWLAQLRGEKQIGLHGAGDPSVWKEPAQEELVTLSEGDVLVIPANQLHSARSLAPSLTLSFNYVDRNNLLAFLRAIADQPDQWRTRLKSLK